MRKGYYIGIYALALSGTVCAGDMGTLSSSPEKHFFIGIGGADNNASLDKQTIYGKGVNKAYISGVLQSQGSAAGTSSPFYENTNPFSPHAQVGYFQNFKNGINFWGAKFTYDYLNAHLADNNMTIPQAGSNNNVQTQQTTYFTGNYLVGSVQTSIKHELLLLAFIGHSFEHCKVYLGAGPSLFGMDSKVNNLVGHADYVLPGQNISGAPAYLSKSMWEWGGVGQIGITYSLSSSWFLDLNYTYAATARDTIKYVSPFTNLIAGQNTVGTSYINPSQQVAVQSFGVSINKVF
jgi:opacity protein-like surface antigen